MVTRNVRREVISMGFIKERNAAAFITLNAILWGSSYIWSKILLGYISYFTLLLIFSAGGLLALTLIYFKRIRSIDLKTILLGLGIGALSIMSNVSCMLALKSTSSSNTAFIVQMSVILTPMLMSAAERKLPGKRPVVSAMIALAGLLLLTVRLDHFSLNPGDLLALANAFFFSLYLVTLKLVSGKADPVQFTFMQHAASTAVFLGLALVFEKGMTGLGSLSTGAVWVLALSTFISVFTILSQARAIRFMRPEKATLIYTLEPVTAAALAYALLGERIMGPQAIIGCLLILCAIVLPAHVGAPARQGTQLQRKVVE